MPVVFNEPVTMLQRAAEGIQYTGLLQTADRSDDPVKRMELVTAFIIASISCNCQRIVKPFNPLLYETYEYIHELEDGTQVKGIAQQVSHHPPITAVCCESDHFVSNGVINPKIKFWGRSIEISHDGLLRIHLKRHNESYLFNAVQCSVHNIIVGKLWFEHHGPLVINCYESNVQANLNFKQAGWFSNDLHRFDGFIVSGKNLSKASSAEKKMHKFVYGKWSDYIKSVDHSEYEKYMSVSHQKQFRIPDRPDESPNGQLTSSMKKVTLSSGSPNSVNNNNSIPSDQQVKASSGKGGDKKSSSGGFTKSDSTQSFDIPNSRTLWRLEAEYLSEYYNFTQFTMGMNELTPELAKALPKTDSRFRPDVRKLEEGDLDGAASEKQRLEDKQREARARDKRFRDPSPDFLFFEQASVPYSKEKFWLYKGGYWENKFSPEKFPDLF